MVVVEALVLLLQTGTYPLKTVLSTDKDGSNGGVSFVIVDIAADAASKICAAIDYFADSGGDEVFF